MVGTVSVVSWPPGMVCTVSFKKSFVVLSSTSNEVYWTPASTVHVMVMRSHVVALKREMRTSRGRGSVSSTAILVHRSRWETFPGAQISHLDAPRVSEYSFLSLSHSWHFAPASGSVVSNTFLARNFPASQDSQLSAPLELVFPGGHGTHVWFGGMTPVVPAGQGWDNEQIFVDEQLDAYHPGAIATAEERPSPTMAPACGRLHFCAPSVFANLPGGHFLQWLPAELPLLLENLPGWHGMHPESDESPVADEYLPGPHKTHSLSFFSPSVPLHRPEGQPRHAVLSARAYLPLVQFSQIAPGTGLN
jgi:hypothetical protein